MTLRVLVLLAVPLRAKLGVAWPRGRHAATRRTKSNVPPPARGAVLPIRRPGRGRRHVDAQAVDGLRVRPRPAADQAASPALLARVLRGLRRLDAPTPPQGAPTLPETGTPTASTAVSTTAVGTEPAPLIHAAHTHRPEAPAPTRRVEPSPDAIRTEPIPLVGVVLQ